MPCPELKKDNQGVLASKKPTTARSEARTKAVAVALAEGERRIVADVPERIHREVRLRCLERGVLVGDYILEPLAKDGIR